MTALLSAVCYGSADYLGGRATRLSDARLVVLYAQLAGLLLLIAVTVAYSSPISGSGLAIGAGVGAASSLSLTLLFYALANARASVVAPLAAVLGAVVPLSWDIARGTVPSGAAASGVALALGGILLLVATPCVEHGPTGTSRRWLYATVVAGLAAGVALTLLGLIPSVGRSPWSLITERVVTSIVLVVALRPSDLAALAVPVNSGAMAAMTGVGYVAATTLYLAAADEGSAGLAAVLASLFPAVTVLLARLIDRERVGRPAVGGLVACVSGTMLMVRG